MTMAKSLALGRSMPRRSDVLESNVGQRSGGAAAHMRATSPTIRPRFVESDCASTAVPFGADLTRSLRVKSSSMASRWAGDNSDGSVAKAIQTAMASPSAGRLTTVKPSANGVTRADTEFEMLDPR